MQRFTFDVAMVDGTTHQAVSGTVADQVNFSTTRNRHNWPSMQEDPVLAQNYLAFAACRRLGLFAGSWDDFCAQALAVGMTAIDVDPTQPTTLPG